MFSCAFGFLGRFCRFESLIKSKRPPSHLLLKSISFSSFSVEKKAEYNKEFKISTGLSLFSAGDQAVMQDTRKLTFVRNVLMITSGEDCACRLWGSDGSELKTIKEHIGRGIWQCLYDPQYSLRVTAGFDSTIKVRQLSTSLSNSVENFDEATEGMKVFHKLSPEFRVCWPYVQFAYEDMIYIATNHGIVYRVQISESGNVKWNKLVHASDGAQIIYMDLFVDTLSVQYYTGV